MQRKPGYPVANCNIRMPDNVSQAFDAPTVEDNSEHRQLQLINFGHSQWGFNNWSWAVSKQELDFVDFSNGKYAAGVVAFVTVTVKTLDIHRENIGYSTSVASMKGSTIYQARKSAVTNALRETLLAFGGSVATELMELLETSKSEAPPTPAVEPLKEISQNLPNKPMNEQRYRKKESPVNVVPVASAVHPANHVSTVNQVNAVNQVPVNQVAVNQVPVNQVKAVNQVNAVNAKIRSPHPMGAPAPAPPVARAAPMPVSLPAAAAPHAPPAPRAPHPAPPRNNEKGMEEMTEEEARAERKRRQRQAQEEFRLKQMTKKNEDSPEKSDSDFNKTSLDKLLSDVSMPEVPETGGKRKSPEPDAGGAPKRRGGFVSKLDIVQGD